MHNVGTIAGATYAELVRRPVYTVTLGVFALLIFCSSFLTQFTFYREVHMVREMGFASLTLWGFIVLVSLSGVIITQELEDRTAVTLLSKPVRRSAFLLGKYFGLLWALLMGMGVLAGVLFYTLWWMAKGRLFGDPRWALELLAAGSVASVAGAVGWIVAGARVRRREAATAVAAPRGALRAAQACLVIGIVLLMAAAGFSRGTLFEGDAAHYRLWREEGRFTPEGPAGTYSVWHFVGDFLESDGTIVLEGLFLSFLQVAVLAALCVSAAAFAPPVISVAATTLVFLMGNLLNAMRGSLERLESPVISAFTLVAYYLLPNLSYFNLQTHFSEGRIISLEYLTLALLHAGIYSTLALTVSCSFFERREIR
ncbi:MAG: hypothetical protein HYY16_12800 [Planctomycetes bacterium]|nr:hypothetical protein [Planctomycetota bacterium]